MYSEEFIGGAIVPKSKNLVFGFGRCFAPKERAKLLSQPALEFGPTHRLKRNIESAERWDPICQIAR